MFKNKLVYLSLIILLFTSCKEEIQRVITLSEPVQNENVILLNWKADIVPGFKYYQVLRAVDGLHYSTINHVDSAGSDAYNKDITSFSDMNFPFVDSIYYKIQAIGDDIISSRNVCIHIKKPFMFDQPIRSACIYPDIQKALIFTGYGDAQMYLYNLSTSLIDNNLKIHVESTGSQIGYGKYNGNYEYYFFDSWNDIITVYNAMTMAKVGSLSMWSDYPSIISDKNGNIFIFSEYSSNITIINREQFIKTNFYYNYFQTLKYNTDKNTISAVCSSKFVEFSLDLHGNMTPLTTKDIPAYGFNLFIENSDLLYRGNSGSRKVINTNTWQEYTLKDENNAYCEFSVLYSKNKIVYASKGTRIYCYSLNDLKLVRMLDVRFTPTQFLSDDHYLYFYGSYNTQNLLDKIVLL